MRWCNFPTARGSWTVCPPETSDEHCRFTVVSFWQDHDEVGELEKYRDMNVQIRGIVQPMHGRVG